MQAATAVRINYTAIAKKQAVSYQYILCQNGADLGVEVPNFGKVSLREIKDVLAGYDKQLIGHD